MFLNFQIMTTKFPPTYIPDFHYDKYVNDMTYNDFGRTGLKVSKLGFGGATIGLCKDSSEEEEGIKTVVEAIKYGINYIDTAPYYSETKAETVLGKALKRVPRVSYYIGTKVGRYTSNIPTMFDFSAERTTKSFEESLKRLGLTYIDVIQVHDVEFAPSIDIVLKETLPALQRIRDSGRAKYIGITGYPIKTLKQIVELSPVKIDLVLSYCRCTLFDNALADYIPFFKNKGIGIINAASLGMGLLTNNAPPVWHPGTPAIKDVCKTAVKHCRQAKVDISKLALHHSYSQSDISTHLVGMSTRTVLNQNLEVLINGLNSAEGCVLREIKSKYFGPMKEHNWENIEVTKYWSVINKKKTKQ